MGCPHYRVPCLTIIPALTRCASTSTSTWYRSTALIYSRNFIYSYFTHLRCVATIYVPTIPYSYDTSTLIILRAHARDAVTTRTLPYYSRP